jgi:hypothetical protein
MRPAEDGACVAIADKVMALVRLAGSDSSEEARTAAFQACRLIREHGLTIVGGQASTQTAPSRGTQSPFYDDFYDAMRRTYERHEQAQKSWNAPPTPDRKHPIGNEGFARGDTQECHECKANIPFGAPVYFDGGNGGGARRVWHRRCPKVR